MAVLSRCLELDVASDPVLFETALEKHKRVLVEVGDAERKHPEAGERIGEEGTCAEACAIVMLDRGALVPWSLDSGPNYGRDLELGTIPGVDKPIEVKYTKYLGQDYGILFMRCKSGDSYPGGKLGKDYWVEHLPDSYYILFHQPEPELFPFRFCAVGWATRQMFLSNWPGNWRWEEKLNKNEDGYPAICLISRLLRPMDRFVVPFGLDGLE